MPEENLTEAVGNLQNEFQRPELNLVPPSILSGSRPLEGPRVQQNINKGWDIVINKKDLGYFLQIGCKNICLTNRHQLISILSNYYKILDEEPDKDLESIFNSLKTESERLEFLQIK